MPSPPVPDQDPCSGCDTLYGVRALLHINVWYACRIPAPPVRLSSSGSGGARIPPCGMAYLWCYVNAIPDAIRSGPAYRLPP